MLVAFPNPTILTETSIFIISPSDKATLVNTDCGNWNPQLAQSAGFVEFVSCVAPADAAVVAA